MPGTCRVCINSSNVWPRIRAYTTRFGVFTTRAYFSSTKKLAPYRTRPIQSSRRIMSFSSSVRPASVMAFSPSSMYSWRDSAWIMFYKRPYDRPGCDAYGGGMRLPNPADYFCHVLFPINVKGLSKPISGFGSGAVIKVATHQQRWLVRGKIEVELLLVIFPDDFEDPLQGIHVL